MADDFGALWVDPLTGLTIGGVPVGATGRPRVTIGAPQAAAAQPEAFGSLGAPPPAQPAPQPQQPDQEALEAAQMLPEWNADPRTWFQRLTGAFAPQAPAQPATEPDRRGPFQKLFGEFGDRVQLWPEKVIRSGLSLPGDVASGEVPQWQRDPTTGEMHTSAPMIERAQDTAGLAGGGSFGASRAAAPAVALSDSALPGAPLAALERAPTFYSGLARTVEALPQQKAPGVQWLGMLQNKPGVKPEEMEWTGLRGFLEQNRGRAVTKQEVLDHLDANQVAVNDVWKGDLKFNDKSKYALPEVVRAARQAGDTPEDLGLTLANDGDAYRALTKKFPELRGNEDWAEVVANDVFGGTSMPSGTTKYHDYQLPGGENYRELLMTTPEKRVSEAEARRILNAGPDDPLSPADIQYASRKAMGGNEYRSSHWDEPNILAHVRMNDRVMPVAATPEDIAAVQARETAQQSMAANRAEQHDIARQIRATAKPLDAALKEQVQADLRAGKIDIAEANRRVYEHPDYAELKPLQDRLNELRAQESAISRGMPPAPPNRSARTLHLEEIQSDWHQQGRDKGYRGNADTSGWTAKEGAGDLASGPIWEVRDSNGRWVLGVPREGRTAEQAIQRAASSERGPDGSRVPDAPFKKNWHELARTGPQARHA